MLHQGAYVQPRVSNLYNIAGNYTSYICDSGVLKQMGDVGVALAYVESAFSVSIMLTDDQVASHRFTHVLCLGISLAAQTIEQASYLGSVRHMDCVSPHRRDKLRHSQTQDILRGHTILCAYAVFFVAF